VHSESDGDLRLPEPQLCRLALSEASENTRAGARADGTAAREKGDRRT